MIAVAKCPSHACPSYGALGQEPMAGQEGRSQENSWRLGGFRENGFKGLRQVKSCCMLENR